MKPIIIWTLLGITLCFQRSAGNNADIILFTNRSGIQTVTLPNTNHHTIPLSGLSTVKYLDFDPEENVIYWSDYQEGTISKVSYCGEGQQIIANVTKNAFISIAVDYVQQRLYWTDSRMNVIESSKLDGTDRKVVATYDMTAPRDIAVDPINKKLYWLDSGTKPKIESCNLDGSNRKVIIDLADAYPSALALDIQKQKLYWSNNNGQQLLVADTDGSEQRIIMRENMPLVTGLAVFGDYIYWPNSYGNKIERVNKNTGLNRADVYNKEGDLEDMVFLRVNKSVIQCPPTPPSNVTVVNVTQDSVTLSWIPGYNWGVPQTFFVEQSLAGMATNWTLATTVDNTGKDRMVIYLVEDLLSGKEYNFRLYPCNINGCNKGAAIEFQAKTEEKVSGSSTSARPRVTQVELYVAIFAMLTVLGLSFIIALGFGCIVGVDKCCGISKKSDKYSAVTYTVTSSSEGTYNY